jgi:hypothetical protein
VSDGPKTVEALGKLSADAHDWTGDGYHCTTCWSSMHCAQCAGGCGGQGHYVIDDAGGYFHCQEPDRWEIQRSKLIERMGRRS